MMINKLSYSIILIVFVFVLRLNSFGQSSLVVADTRDVATTPSTYARSFQTHLKFANAIGLDRTFPNIFYTVLGVKGWSDDTGGKAHELAFSNDNRLLIRSGYNSGWEGWRSVLISSSNGFYGLGTLTPKEMLSVNGNIRAHEIKVEIKDWPDFVFSEDYKYESLPELESFIKRYKHLPDMPTAIEAEDNGIALGEMNKKLLQKIEEITLHLIEKDKQIQVQESNSKQQDARINKLEELLNKLIPNTQ